MPQDLIPRPHPDEVSALREISLDRLGFTQRCTQDYQDQGIIPLPKSSKIASRSSKQKTCRSSGA